jgi:FMN phosphatase YigB (HAD superfamily)
VTFTAVSTGQAVKAVLFDVFGTVVDWRSGVAAAVRRAAAGPPPGRKARAQRQSRGARGGAAGLTGKHFTARKQTASLVAFVYVG